MMKKLLLLSAAGALGALNVSAQYLHAPLRNMMDNRASISTVPAVTPPSAPSTAKVTATGTRRYDHEAYMESTSTATFNGSSFPIWQDSTVRVNYTGGIGSINFSSACQVIYPFDKLWNDPTNPNFLGQIAVTTTNSYTIDSVHLAGLYVQGNSPGSSAAPDTLLIALAVQPPGNTWFWRGSASSWALPYLPSGKDTLYTASPINVDSVRRMALSNPTTAANYSWKEVLPASSRVVLSGSTTFTNFSFKVPTPFVVPAGQVIMVSYTFKSGDTWVKNVDTVTQHHHFRPGFAYPGTAGTTPVSDKQAYNWYAGDHNMSSIMFSTNPDFYTPTIVIGATNTPSSWFYQYMLTSVTVSCSSCDVVKVSSINESSKLIDVAAFPNPANNELNVPFTIQENANVTVSIKNMMGQVIASQDMGNVKAGVKTTAQFNTSAIASGIYLYTVEANGQHITNRFAVTH